MVGRVGPVGLKLRGCVRFDLQKGAVIKFARLEAPKQIGNVERRGAMFTKMMLKVIKDTHSSDRESMDVVVSECLTLSTR